MNRQSQQDIFLECCDQCFWKFYSQDIKLFCHKFETGFSRWLEMATHKCTFYRLLDKQIAGVKCGQEKYCFTNKQYNKIVRVRL